MGFWSDFKKFISKGNIVDLATAVVIGNAFNKIVTGLVNNIIMPVVSLAVGGLNVSDWKYVIKDAVLNEAGEVVEAETAILYGDFIQSILDFLIVALCIFTALRILMKTKNLLNEKQLAAEEAKKKAEEEAAKLEKDFADGLAQQGFETEAEYRAACLPAEETENLDKTIRRHEEAKKSLADRISEREEQLKDRSRADIDALQEQQKELAEQRRQAQERSQSCDRRLSLHQEAGKGIRQAVEEKQKHAEKWAVLDDLYRALSGQLSQKVKITFETYVQQYYFKQVIAAANKRLTQMTDGMFVLRLKEEARDRRSQSGLDLDVLDRATGQWRDVTTLSGGESFLASLSLALGLSDVVQSESGGIRLETMFIDEGFGTLDENALRSALDLLSSLADGKRMIGVISHVPELRERIDKKIVVHKKLTGSQIELEY